jgi:hypothetical protein
LPLPWFRRKKPEDMAPLTRAPETPERKPLTVDTPASGQGDDGQSSTGTSASKRRRGTRGGRNRKKSTAAGSTASPSTTAPAAEGRTPAKKTGERKTRTSSSSSQSRRRTPPKRAPLPKAKRELVISVDAGEKRVAVLEDDQVAEVYLERPERRSIAGNIYLGVVDNVLPGMEAAFVEIGLEKNGFLYVDEIIGPELEGARSKSARKITDLIQRGEKILVQAVKDPMKTKGARLTTEISLPGRFVV